MDYYSYFQENIESMEVTFEWRDVEDYEGLYKVSECGDVMSIGYGKKRLLKPIDNGTGYQYVALCKNGKTKKHYVHRLVATAFCEGAGEFEEVNHLDENCTNNHKDNLEWCTPEYNSNYGTRTKRSAEKRRKKVRCKELDMIFDSVTEAAGYVNSHKSSLSKCLTGKTKTCMNYHWEYVD